LKIFIGKKLIIRNNNMNSLKKYALGSAIIILIGIFLIERNNTGAEILLWPILFICMFLWIMADDIEKEK